MALTRQQNARGLDAVNVYLLNLLGGRATRN